MRKGRKGKNRRAFGAPGLFAATFNANLDEWPGVATFALTFATFALKSL